MSMTAMIIKDAQAIAKYKIEYAKRTLAREMRADNYFNDEAPTLFYKLKHNKGSMNIDVFVEGLGWETKDRNAILLRPLIRTDGNLFTAIIATQPPIVKEEVIQKINDELIAHRQSNEPVNWQHLAKDRGTLPMWEPNKYEIVCNTHSLSQIVPILFKVFGLRKYDRRKFYPCPLNLETLLPKNWASIYTKEMSDIFACTQVGDISRINVRAKVKGIYKDIICCANNQGGYNAQQREDYLFEEQKAVFTKINENNTHIYGNDPIQIQVVVNAMSEELWDKLTEIGYVANKTQDAGETFRRGTVSICKNIWG